MAKKELFANKETLAGVKVRPKGVGRPLTRVKRSRYLFRIYLRESEKGDWWVDLPDIVRPFGDDGRWALLTDYSIGICPFTYDGLEKVGLDIDELLIDYRISDTSIVNLFLSHIQMPSNNGMAVIPLYLIRCYQNGQAEVQFRIKDPDGSGRVVYQKTFTIIVNNPHWPQSGFDGDVRQIGVYL